MRLLLDTHFVLAIADEELHLRFPRWRARLEEEDGTLCVSAASLWEIAIKTRIGKLEPRVAPPLMDKLLARGGIPVLDITIRHVTTTLDPDLPIRDPFDRLLVAVAQVEGMRLVTADRALLDHPVSYRLNS